MYDECITNPCNNGGTCQNHAGSYICTCTSDYTGFFCDDELPTHTVTTDDAEANVGAIVGGVIGGLILVVIAIIAVAIIFIILYFYIYKKGSSGYKPEKEHEVELAKKENDIYI